MRYLLIVAALLFALPVSAKVSGNQGTSAKELKAKNLPDPTTQKLAVLPFWSPDSDQRKCDITTVAVFLTLQREGYQMISLLECERAVAADKKIEPGVPIRREDAARIGEKLGADLVCYGELGNIQTKTEFNIWWGNRRRVQNSTRLAIVSPSTSEIVYWASRSDESAGGMWKTSDSARERHTACVTTYRLLEPVCQALPSHKHTPEKKPDENDALRAQKQLEEERKSAE